VVQALKSASSLTFLPCPSFALRIPRHFDHGFHGNSITDSSAI